MSLLLAGILLLLFIWVFGEISDRMPDDADQKKESGRHPVKKCQYN